MYGQLADYGIISKSNKTVNGQARTSRLEGREEEPTGQMAESAAATELSEQTYELKVELETPEELGRGSDSVSYHCASEDECATTETDMECLLCELAQTLTTDTSSSHTRALSAQPVVCVNIPNSELLTTESAISATKARYENWNMLSEHIREQHCKLDRTRAENDGLMVNGERLLDEMADPVKLKKTILKYSILCCPRCQQTVNVSPSYRNGYLKLCYHLHTKHGDKLPGYVQIYECSSCTYTSYDGKLLALHVEYNHSGRMNKNNQRVSCSMCQKEILQRFLATHMLVKHRIKSGTTAPPVEKLKCSLCSKVLSGGKKNLERHIERVHHKVKDFLCHLCSWSFYERKQLLQHMYMKHELNMQDKPVQCCQVEGCDFTALTGDLISRHVTICHGGNRNFVCSHCGKSFKTPHNLKQHDKIMHPSGSAKFQCAHCSFVSHTEQYLKRHMKIHSDKKKHKCAVPGCQYETHFSENLKKHLKVHSEEHLTRRKAKLDHNYIKRVKRSKKADFPMLSQTSTCLVQKEQVVTPTQSDSVYGYGVSTAAPLHMSNYQLISEVKACQPMSNGPKQDGVYIVNASHKASMSGQELLNLEPASDTNSSSAQPMYHCDQMFHSGDMSNSSGHYMSL